MKQTGGRDGGRKRENGSGGCWEAVVDVVVVVVAVGLVVGQLLPSSSSPWLFVVAVPILQAPPNSPTSLHHCCWVGALPNCSLLATTSHCCARLAPSLARLCAACHQLHVLARSLGVADVVAVAIAVVV